MTPGGRIIVCLMAVLAGATPGVTAGTDAGAVAATWDRGLYFSGTDTACWGHYIGLPTTQADCIRPGPAGATGKLPVVVFLHGCAGWGSRQSRVMQLANANGYTVFAPDSFARPGRVRHCGQGGTNKLEMRLEEVEYAVRRLRELPWVDQERLVLMGFSEGGFAAARYRGSDFRAVLVLGWGCPRGRLHVPGSVPVLNLVGRDDQETRWGNRLCSAWFRDGFRAKHVEAGHDVSEDPRAQAIVGEFLREALQ